MLLFFSSILLPTILTDLVLLLTLMAPNARGFRRGGVFGISTAWDNIWYSAVQRQKDIGHLKWLSPLPLLGMTQKLQIGNQLR